MVRENEIRAAEHAVHADRAGTGGDFEVGDR
jgi:hypothetical protein